MVTTTLDGTPKIRRFERLVGVCIGGQWGVHNHNRSNVVRGLTERVFAVERNGVLVSPPKPVYQAYDKLSTFRRELLRHLVSCRRWTDQEFLDSYHGAKRVAYEKAFASLTLRPLKRQDGYLNTFVKAEKLNLSKKPDPAPRVIQPRSMRYNCCVGPYLKPLEHRLYRGVARVFGSPTIMKGLNSIEQGQIIHKKWHRFHRPVAIGLDASRFDQHVSEPALRWEHSVYNSVYRCPKLAALLEWQIENRGTAHTPDGKIKYSVRGCRMSGDMNTAMGNCLIMCGLLWQYISELGVDAEVVNNGDDCVLFLEQENEHLTNNIKTWFLRYGFNIIAEEPVYVLEKVIFCQTQPVFDGTTWRMVRDPRITMDKDGINLKPSNNPFCEWLATVGECGLALTSGVPVLQEYYLYLMSLGVPKDLEASGMKYLRGNMESKVSAITTEARVSFWRAFDVPPHKQVAVEHYLSNLPRHIDCGLMLPEVVASLELQL